MRTTMMRKMSFAVLALVVLGAMFLSAPAKAAEDRHAQWLKCGERLRQDYGLVAYYDFEEGKGTVLRDGAASPGKSDGTINNAAWVEGRWPGKKALKFNGKDTHVVCGNDASLDLTDAITVEAWIKLDVLKKDQYIISKRSWNEKGGIPCTSRTRTV